MNLLIPVMFWAGGDSFGLNMYKRAEVMLN
jgi:hypothetical protein